MEELKAYAASLGIGLSLGLIGAGGSILTIPVFVYILKRDPLTSAVYSMFVVAVSCLTGTVQSIINRVVDKRTLLLFGIPSVIGVLIARRLIFPSIPTQLGKVASFILSKDIFFMLCLSLVMLLAALGMLRSNSRGDQATAVTQPAPLMFRGLFVGIVAGMLGIGGGFLIVPALYFLAGLPMKKAIGTALTIITVNSSIGFLASFQEVHLEWHLLLRFCAGAVIGILAGTRLSAFMPARLLKTIFGIFIMCISAFIILKEIML